MAPTPIGYVVFVEDIPCAQQRKKSKKIAYSLQQWNKCLNKAEDTCGFNHKKTLERPFTSCLLNTNLIIYKITIGLHALVIWKTWGFSSC